MSNDVSASSAGATIYDQGYRRYTGPRTGMAGSIRTLVKQSLRHALGLGRATRFKVVPVAVVVMAYLPAAVFVGATALLPIDTSDFIPTYADYYLFIAATIYILAGFVAPELLCTDRRTGLLGVYMASPLDRPNYLLGKAIAVFTMLLLVTLGPPLVLLISLSLQNLGPDGFLGWMKTFGAILVSSAIIGVLYTAVALAVSATTDRIPIATATILAAIPGSAIVTDVLVLEGGMDPIVRWGNLLFLPRAIIYRVHGENEGWPIFQNGTLGLWLAWTVWTVGSIAWIWYRYRKMLIRR